ncbi:MAG: hypothetical protein IT383_25130 [Deltaproteobacteria bacterium]|nr:hypothetical protein [Deltaproteobacteria bacterium]
MAASSPAAEASSEEEVDFEEEEKKSEAESERIKAAAGAAPAQGGATGFKLFVDLTAIAKLGQGTFTIKPNHSYVFLMAQINDELSLQLHLSDDPAFYELQWEVMPGLSLKAGKLLVPFGTNDFHHLIGGRVDEESRLLPETWGDFGLSLSHAALDTEWLALDYTLYAVNGFQGSDEPGIAAGTGIDNNYMKGLGARARLVAFSDYIVTGSAYFDVWDSRQRYKLLYYALGAELKQGFVPIPVLDRLRVRGEWARGEIELPGRALQVGLIGPYSVARTGFYAEGNLLLWEGLSARVRTGRVNSDNTTTLQDEDDVWLLEPAVVWWVAHNKVQLTLAYQALLPAGRAVDAFDPFDPGDVVYGKVFLQF